MSSSESVSGKGSMFPTVFAAVLLMMAVGIVLFWVNWFASGDFRTAGNDCYRAFENSFPLPDGVLTLLLVATAVAALRRSALALLFGYIAAGMLLYLASLDFLYGAIHKGYSDLHSLDTWSRILICTACCGVSGFLTVGLERLPIPCPFLPREDEAENARAKLFWMRTLNLMLLYVVLTSMKYYVVPKITVYGPAWDRCYSDHVHFMKSFSLAKTFTFAFGLAALIHLPFRHPRALPLTLLYCGCLLFYALISLLNIFPDVLNHLGSELLYDFWLCYALLLTWSVWGARSMLRGRKRHVEPAQG